MSLINTINSIMGVDLDAHDARRRRHRRQGHARRHVRPGGEADRARRWWPRSPAIRRPRGLPISAIGGVTTWRDAAEFIALGAGNVQVCTAAMTYGFKIVEEMISGLAELHGRARATRRSRISAAAPSPNVTDWQHLNLNYVAKAEIDQDLCIKCGRCHIVCEDTSHQAIFAEDRRRAAVRGQRRRMRRLQPVRRWSARSRTASRSSTRREGVDPRTGLPYAQPPRPWTTHPNNPAVRRRRNRGAAVRLYCRRRRLTALRRRPFRSP